MQISSFVDRLKRMKPSITLLMNRGYDEQHTGTILKNYELPIRTENFDSTNSDAISELLIRYQANYLRFADYRFADKPMWRNKNQIFCSSSSTLIGCANAHSEVFEWDKEEFTLLYKCSRDFPSFLDAICCVFELNSLRLQGQVNRNDNAINRDYVTRAAKFAGGASYLPFFESIIL